MITIYHYEKCSKSRGAFCILEEKSAKFTTRFYLKEPLSVEELKKLHQKLNIPVIDMIRTNEKIYKELFSASSPDDEELFKVMATYPILLQRPIIELDNHAIIARPPEKIFDLLV